MESLVNIGIILAYIMISFGAITAIVFGVKKLISKQENTKKTLYIIGGLILIVIVSYLIASGQVPNSYEKYNITSSVSKRVGMGLNMFYFLSIGAVGTILYTELSKMFSK
jgi:sulfite exporter TauE/SafE